MKRLLWAVAFALAAAVPAVAARTGPSYGVADDAPKYAADGGDRYFAMLSGDLGMSEDRITVYWDAGQPSTIQEKISAGL